MVTKGGGLPGLEVGDNSLLEPWRFLGSFFFLRSSKPRLGAGSAMMVGLGWMGFRLGAISPAGSWPGWRGTEAGTMGRALLGGRITAGCLGRGPSILIWVVGGRAMGGAFPPGAPGLGKLC